MTMNEAPPPMPPTGLLMKRCKFIWRFLLLSNLALGGQNGEIQWRFIEKQHKKLHKGKATVEVPPEPITSSMDLDYDDFIVPVTMPVEVWAPIPEEQQREIFKWILEEKRKVKPKDGMEKKQIDDEKAILKQFLRAKTIPKF